MRHVLVAVFSLFLCVSSATAQPQDAPVAEAQQLLSSYEPHLDAPHQSAVIVREGEVLILLMVVTTDNRKTLAHTLRQFGTPTERTKEDRPPRFVCSTEKGPVTFVVLTARQLLELTVPALKTVNSPTS